MNIEKPNQTQSNVEKSRELISIAKILGQRHWMPATSGNISVRGQQENTILVTASGKNKGALTDDDLLLTDLNGHLLTPDKSKKPSAECQLHCQIYGHLPHIEAVIHTHSEKSTILSRLMPAGSAIELTNYELLKAFPGCSSHLDTQLLACFNNSQNMGELCTHTKKLFEPPNNVLDPESEIPRFLPAYLIKGHGLYTWAPTLSQALIQLEALEQIMACEIQLMCLPNNQSQTQNTQLK